MQQHLYIQIDYCDDTDERIEFQDTRFGEMQWEQQVWDLNRKGEESDKVWATHPHVTHLKAMGTPGADLLEVSYRCPCQDKASA